MKTPIQSLIILIVLLSSLVKGYSQDNYASNVHTTISEDQKLFIHYDLVVNDGSKFFKVELEFSYEEEIISPNPNNLYGHYGRAMTPGNKIIYWNYSDDFSGDISKVKVNVLATREAEPKAQFKKDSLGNNGYAPCDVVYVNQSTNADKYEWNFGDPASGVENISYDENPIHIFKAGGSYTITLTAINTRLDVSHTFKETIIVKEYGQTLADFQIISYNNEVPIKIEFKNTSRNADTFLWNFDDPRSGNKNTSTEENPEHKYVDDGKYAVELTASNSISGFTDKTSKDVLLIRPEKGTYQKHKTLKNVWLTAGIVSLGTGVYTMSKAISINNGLDSITSTDVLEDLKKESKTYGTISVIAYGLSAVCGVQVYIHAKKQSEAAKQVRLQVTPIQDGALLSLSYKFK